MEKDVQKKEDGEEKKEEENQKKEDKEENDDVSQEIRDILDMDDDDEDEAIEEIPLDEAPALDEEIPLDEATILRDDTSAIIHQQSTQAGKPVNNKTGNQTAESAAAVEPLIEDEDLAAGDDEDEDLDGVGDDTLTDVTKAEVPRPPNSEEVQQQIHEAGDDEIRKLDDKGIKDSSILDKDDDTAAVDDDLDFAAGDDEDESRNAGRRS